jgi:hypothetical protein
MSSKYMHNGLGGTLLRVCRIIHDEALPVLYGKTTFAMHPDKHRSLRRKTAADHLQRSPLRDLQSLDTAHMRSITFCLERFDPREFEFDEVAKAVSKRRSGMISAMLKQLDNCARIQRLVLNIDLSFTVEEVLEIFKVVECRQNVHIALVDEHKSCEEEEEEYKSYDPLIKLFNAYV